MRDLLRHAYSLQIPPLWGLRLADHSDCRHQSRNLQPAPRLWTGFAWHASRPSGIAIPPNGYKLSAKKRQNVSQAHRGETRSTICLSLNCSLVIAPPSLSSDVNELWVNSSAEICSLKASNSREFSSFSTCNKRKITSWFHQTIRQLLWSSLPSHLLALWLTQQICLPPFLRVSSWFLGGDC